jgi:hypothetical protein
VTDFAIRPATRKAFQPLVGLYAESGAGKTFSALLLARGLAGPSGNVTMIDTEGGRGSLYADVIPGGYQVLDLEPPFPPGKLIEAIDAVEKSKADVLIVDSASHFWEGIGGVLEWAGENEAAGKKGRQIWKDPKMAHERMVGRLLQTRLPVIVCLRAKHLLVERIDQNTKRKEMVKDPDATPKQAEDFIYCMTFHAEIRQDHSLRITKVSHPTLRSCFPEQGPITIATGEALAQWCARPGQTVASKPDLAVKTAPSESDPTKVLKGKLWSLARSYVGAAGSSLEEVENALNASKIIGKPLKELSLVEMGEAVDKLEVALSEITP